MALEFSVIALEKIRLDAYLCEILKISRRQARNYCDNALVKVNGRYSRSGNLIKHGDCVFIASEPIQALPGQVPSSLKIDVIYQNEDFLILNKPVASHCVRLKSSDPETIADFLAINFAETITASNDIRESGLVNRLDYYTSGIILAAKSKIAWQQLRRSQSKMLKTYYALVWGRAAVQKINLALKNKNNFKVMPDEQGVETIETNIISSQIIKYNGNIFSLVKLQGHAFKRHQLRAHLSHIGNPLVGDEIYQGENSDILNREGFFLHSENIKFQYDNSDFDFTAKSLELDKIKKIWGQSPFSEIL